MVDFIFVVIEFLFQCGNRKKCKEINERIFIYILGYNLFNGNKEGVELENYLVEVGV